MNKDKLREFIDLAFANVSYPGDSNLRNSDEGVEPFLLEDEFAGKDDWRLLSSDFIDRAPDGFGSALSFFSKEAFRFYLPAYLLADIADELLRADPLFHLTHGLTNATKDQRINSRRYSRFTWFEYVSDRFSDFTPEQAQAIILYLNNKLDDPDLLYEHEMIQQALRNFWEDAAS